MNRQGIGHAGRVLLAAAALAVGGSALADRWHGGHGHARVGVGVFLGPGYAYPSYPYYPGYYPSPVVVVPSSPPQYIERSDDLQQGEGGEPQVQQPTYWYHCAKPEGYYPYVRDCPAGWDMVPAQPPAK